MFERGTHQTNDVVKLYDFYSYCEHYCDELPELTGDLFHIDRHF